jgi:hypothetical protein
LQADEIKKHGHEMKQSVFIYILFLLSYTGCRESFHDPIDSSDRNKINLLLGRWELVNSIPDSKFFLIDFLLNNRVWVIDPVKPDSTLFGYFVKKGNLTLYTFDNPPDRIESDYYIAEIDSFDLKLYFYGTDQIYITTYKKITWH